MLQRYVLLFFIALTLSCQSDKAELFKLPDNAYQMIAGDSIKTWKLTSRYNNGTRMNMGDCFLSYRVTYSRDSIIRDNNSEHRDCGESLRAKWTFYNNEGQAFVKIKGSQLQELMQIEKDYKFFKLIDLNDERLVLEFKHRQYGNKATTILDTLVPENLLVKGRDFHW